MESIIDYFATIPSSHRSALLIGGLTIFFLIENAIPLFKAQYNKWKHTGINLFFTATTVIINFAMAFILVNTAFWVENNGIGLLQMLDMNIYLTMIIGLVLMDLVGAYAPHWVEHHIKWMWKFHLIHHTDQNVDTTTANRHHPGESVIRFVFTTLAVIILGAPMWLVFMYQSMSLVLTQFNHSNIKMPGWLDDTLVLLFCTPNMHRVHHHYRQPYSDKNYGNIFSIWDRVFGTYVKVDNSKLTYGVDTHMTYDEAHNVGTLLKIPFQKYREPIVYPNEEKL
ncbi:MAG: sterol desaturase family protein [Bacteroidota bacterium]